MPCFGNSDDSRYPLLCVKCAFPPDPGEYLPRLTEHKIQTEPDDVIDDPSSVFFDPNEKAGFVYTHVPSISFDYAKQLILTLPESKQEKLVIASKKDTNERERQVSVCSDFADSLDRTPSLRGSPLPPLHDPNNLSNGFNEHFKPISRQDSLEFDPIVDGPICQVTLNNKDFCRPPSKDLPTGLSEDDVRTLYKTSHEPFFIDDFNDMHIYEENILNDITKTNGNKGYISDAESVKTYQDSGIYDDDIIIESPSRLNHIQYPKGEMFDDDGDDMQMEKYSAFKTPLSSRHNSLEYLPLDSPLKSIIKHPRKTDHRGRREDADGTGGSENDSLDNELKETFLDLESSEKRSKKGDKYSHIQAKVQCFRSKADSKSPSRGPPTRRKTPDSKNTKRADLKRTQSRIGAKPKVDSLSNVKYTPGGGGTKVFKEKLKFRENAQPRTDTHGIEMYAHLPTEFQEIARRLARQDSQLKEQKTTRGRSLSRTRSSESRPSSRSPKRGRSRTKKSKLTAGDSISNIQNEVKQNKQLELESTPIVKRPTLSRSSSIRSVPSAPKIHQRHPSSSKITRTPSGSSQSPSASTPRIDTTSKAKKRVVSKTKGERALKAKEEKHMKAKAGTPRGNEKLSKLSKMKQDTSKMSENTQKLTANALQMAENTAKMTDGLKNLSEDTLDLEESMPYINDGLKLSENVCSLSQYISENETFGSRQRGGPFNEEVKTNPLPSLCQYITDHDLMDSSHPEDIMKSVCQYAPDNELFDASQLYKTRSN